MNVHSFIQKIRVKGRKITKKINTAAVCLITASLLLFFTGIENADAETPVQKNQKDTGLENTYEEVFELSYDFSGRYMNFPVTSNSERSDELIDNLSGLLTVGAAIDIDIFEMSGIEGFAYDDYEESIGILGSSDSSKDETTETDVKSTVEQVSNSVEAKNSSDSMLEKKYNKNFIMDISKKDKEVLYRIVEAEATGENIYGKMLVANVVLNRVLDEEFPDTVEEVVFQKGQFAPTRDGRYYKVEITETTIEAVDRVLNGEDYSKGSLYFFARKLTTAKKAKWFDNSLKKVLKYGAHEFYKNK